MRRKPRRGRIDWWRARRFYYLIVLKQALVAAPAPGAGHIVVPLPAAIALASAASLLLLLGLFPSLLLGRF